MFKQYAQDASGQGRAVHTSHGKAAQPEEEEVGGAAMFKQYAQDASGQGRAVHASHGKSFGNLKERFPHVPDEGIVSTLEECNGRAGKAALALQRNYPQEEEDGGAAMFKKYAQDASSTGRAVHVSHKKAEEAVKDTQASLGLDVFAVEQAQREHLRAIFATLDIDSSGFITLDEMQAFSFVDRSLQQVLFDSMDAVGQQDGRIGLDEFMAYWESAVGSAGWSSVKAATNELIANKMPGKGQGEDSEALVTEMRPIWARRAAVLFRSIDKDKNSELDREELLEWAEKHPTQAKGFLPSLDDLGDWEKFDDWLTGAGSTMAVDSDGNWQISMTEFATLYSKAMENTLTSDVA